MATELKLDRRQARRAATIDELLSVAIEVMAESGVAGLSLGEVARRMGVRPPSLYVYIDSKNAVYDAVFARGWRQVQETMSALPDPTPDVVVADYLSRAATLFTQWCLAHPVHAQLMTWRPVPSWEPSTEAFVPAVEVVERSRRQLARLQELDLLRTDVGVDVLLDAWTVFISGVISQQLANGPSEPFATATYPRLIPDLVAMYCTHFAPAPRRRTTSRGTR